MNVSQVKATVLSTAPLFVQSKYETCMLKPQYFVYHNNRELIIKAKEANQTNSRIDLKYIV